MSATAKSSRRLFLAAGPAAAVFGALALSAAIPSVDPIFAAIERHRAAWDAFGAAGPAADNILAKQQGRVVTQSDCDALDAASEFEREAFGEMLNTSPTTLPGLRAAVEHLAEIERGCVPEASGYFLFKLLENRRYSPASRSGPPREITGRGIDDRSSRCPMLTMLVRVYTPIASANSCHF